MEMISARKQIFRAVIKHVVDETNLKVWTLADPAHVNNLYLYFDYVYEVLNLITIDEQKLTNIHSQSFKDYLNEVAHKFIPMLDEVWLKFVSTGVASFFAFDRRNEGVDYFGRLIPKTLEERIQEYKRKNGN